MKSKYNNVSTSVAVKILLFTVFLLLGISLAIYISHPDNANSYLNPDPNTLTYLAFNLIYEKGSLWAWQLGSSPVFFPDMLIVGIIALFKISPFYNLITFVILQISFFSILIVRLLKTVTQSSVGIRLGAISLFIFFYTILQKHNFHLYNEYDYYTTMFYCGFHFSVLLLTLLSTLLFLRVLKKPSFLSYLFLFVVMFLGGISDPLFYIYFPFPMMATIVFLALFGQLSKQEFWRYISFFILTFIVTFSAYHLIPIHYTDIKLKPNFQVIFFLYFVRTIFYFIQKNLIWGILWLCFVILSPLSIWASLKSKSKECFFLGFIIILQLLTVVVSTPLIIFSINQTFPPDQITYPTTSFLTHPRQFYDQLLYLPYQYFTNFFIMPVFIGIPVLIYKHNKNILEKFLSNNWLYIAVLSLFIILTLLFRPHHFHKKMLFNFQSKLTNCLVDNKAKFGLTNGITNSYYVTNLINAYAQGKIHMALVSDQLAILRWQNSAYVYQFNQYDFFLSNSNKIDPYLFKKYGSPTAVKTCKDNFDNTYYIYIYKNGKLNNVFKQ